MRPTVDRAQICLNRQVRCENRSTVGLTQFNPFTFVCDQPYKHLAQYSLTAGLSPFPRQLTKLLYSCREGDSNPEPPRPEATTLSNLPHQALTFIACTRLSGPCKNALIAWL
jgi:hypothetical protein